MRSVRRPQATGATLQATYRAAAGENRADSGAVFALGGGIARPESRPAAPPIHLEGILNYCRTRIAMGVVEAINGNIKTLLRRGRGYKNLRYLLLKAQRMAATKTEFVTLRKAA